MANSNTTGGQADQTLIDAKWESIALVHAGDSAFPDDFFLFTAVRTIYRDFSMDYTDIY